MKFNMWSFGHILYLLSPFIIFGVIYFLIKDKDEKIKNKLGFVLGIFSVSILVIRNVDIYIRSGMSEEVIPLQVCHIGSVIAGLALIFKKKWLIITAFCFNLMPALLAMVFADALANYDTILKIRPQTYIWGHILIIVCALYGMFVYLPKLDKKDLKHSIIFVLIMAVCGIICNSAFRAAFNWEPNYFYIYDYSGTPLKFLYNITSPITYGWFTINYLYTGTLLAVFLGLFIGLFYLSKRIISKITL